MSASPVEPIEARKPPALRVVQVTFHADPRARDADDALDEWTSVTGTAGALRAQGVDLTVLIAAERAETVRRGGVTFELIDDTRARPTRVLGPVRFRRKARRILDRVKALDPDVVHVHDLALPMAVHDMTAAVPRLPVLVQDHGIVPPRGWRRHAWRWALADVAGAAFTVAHQAREFQALGILRRDLPIFETLPASTMFTPGNRDEARKTAGVFGDPCFLWTTHLDANKDPLTALDAFEMAAARLPDARLWMAFVRRPLLNLVRERIAASRVLRERVALLGARPRDQMEALFRAADFFVQTSRREASGRSLIEALACGTTALVTDLPPWRRIVGECGSLTPVGDADALAAAMVEWATKDRTALREAARRCFEESLSFDVIGRELKSIYETLAALKPRRAIAPAKEPSPPRPRTA